MVKMNRIAAVFLSGIIMCSAPASAMASDDIDTSAIESLVESGIDAVFGDTDRTVSIIMYVKEKIDGQNITDDQILSAIDDASSYFGVSLTDAEKNSLLSVAKSVKDADIDEEKLKEDVSAVYDKLESAGVNKEGLKGLFRKAVQFIKGFFS